MLKPEYTPIGYLSREIELKLHEVYKHRNYFMDIYVVRKDLKDEEVILDKSEVVDWTWLSKSEIEQFIETGKIVRSVGIRYKMFGMNLMEN